MPDIKDGKLLRGNLSETLISSSIISNTLVNTLIPDKFKEFIDSRLKERKNIHSAKKNMNLKIMPKFKGLFETSFTAPSKIWYYFKE